MPRAALLSIHARVEGTEPTTWEDPSLVQLWGPRFNALCRPEAGHRAVHAWQAPTSPDESPQGGRHRRSHGVDLAGRRITDRELARELGIGNAMRYAAPHGHAV